MILGLPLQKCYPWSHGSHASPMAFSIKALHGQVASLYWRSGNYAPPNDVRAFEVSCSFRFLFKQSNGFCSHPLSVDKLDWAIVGVEIVQLGNSSCSTICPCVHTSKKKRGGFLNNFIPLVYRLF
jgi:hypothetical protein